MANSLLFYLILFAVSFPGRITALSEPNQDDTLLEKWEFRFVGKDSSKIINPGPMKEVGLPHSYNFEKTIEEHRKGLGVYQKTILKTYNQAVENILYFEGACLRTAIYINNKKNHPRLFTIITKHSVPIQQKPKTSKQHAYHLWVAYMQL